MFLQGQVPPQEVFGFVRDFCISERLLPKRRYRLIGVNQPHQAPSQRFSWTSRGLYNHLIFGFSGFWPVFVFGKRCRRLPNDTNIHLWLPNVISPSSFDEAGTALRDGRRGFERSIDVREGPQFPYVLRRLSPQTLASKVSISP